MTHFFKQFAALRALKLLPLMLLFSIALYAQDSAKAVKIDEEAFGDNSRHWYGIFDKAKLCPESLVCHWESTVDSL